MKPIVFIDRHGTLSFDRFRSSIYQGKPVLGEKLNSFLFEQNKEKIGDWMKGKHTSEEICDFVAEHLEVDKLWFRDLFVRDCKTMGIRKDLKPLLAELRKKYYLILATGNMDCFTRFTIPSQGLENQFDMIVNSYDRGYLKTENNGMTFLEPMKSFGSEHIQDCFHIDDCPKTCAYFERLGGTALHVTAEKDTAEYLKELAQEKQTQP